MVADRQRPLRILLLVVAAHIILLGMELPAPWTDVGSMVTAALFALLVRKICRSAADALILLVLGLVAPALNILVPWGTWLALDIVKIAFWTAAPAFLAWKILVSIYAASRVTLDEIFGAIALYLLLGLLFANVYEGLFLVDPEGLRFGTHFAAADIGFGDVLYFSFVTLATLGYGDISPSHPLTRIVAVTESVTGLMYLAVLITRFVSLHVSHHPTTKGD